VQRVHPAGAVTHDAGGVVHLLTGLDEQGKGAFGEREHQAGMSDIE
jgi:hypothetical protein